MATALKDLPEVLQGILDDGVERAVSPEQMKDAMRLYCERISAGDVEGVVALFAPDCVVKDPVNAPAHIGRDKLRAFFSTAFAAQGGFLNLRMVGEPRVAGDYGAFACEVITTADGCNYLIETLDVMRFDADGLFATLDTYWGPSGISKTDRSPQRFV